MLGYVIRRILIAIPTILVIVTVAFFMMRAAPGSPFDLERPMSEEIRQRVLAAYNLDQPPHIQYVYFLGDLARGDLGPSLRKPDKTVVEMIGENIHVSAVIGVSSLVLALLVGGTLGVTAALRQNRPSDFMVMAVALVGISVPPFVVGPLLQLLVLQVINPHVIPFLDQFTPDTLRSFPTAGLSRGQLEPHRLFLPVVTLALPQIAIISRLVRASMIEVIRSNYIRTARAKGLSTWRIVTRHALRAAAPPLVSYLGPASAALITGSLVIEQIYDLPGIGQQFVTSALERDYTVVMGLVIVFSTLIIMMNLISDLLLAAFDPKVRLQ